MTTASSGLRISQRVRRQVSEGIRIEIVKVAQNTERTCRLVIILKLRFRIDVVLYVRDRKNQGKAISN